MDPYLPETMAAERRRDLIAEAARARLVALATCCRVSALGRAVSRVRDGWRGRSAARGAACCAPS
ncbi:hypothetical protein [Jiangella sp. DSM 45060]|uniref:hypothetical protein n=1 Tax=Jiangella sp. DSM 45060 TaxID=1798224 RepID=UPI000879526F|nr:hypothetical protein [Jiangella sp. DSM 45060]SDT20314.1 hypothetical protein SAMN04515669_3089 [Jiangella sp. DSM 45060]